MQIAGIYSFNGGLDYIKQNYGFEFDEIQSVIEDVDCEKCKTKISNSKNNKGRVLYSPVQLNREFKSKFHSRVSGEKWDRRRIKCRYSIDDYQDGYQITATKTLCGFREIDFVKSKVGVEVQFGKYSFMLYDVLGKIPVFKNKGIVDCGVEIVPTKDFTNMMCSGVACYEQLVWDLKMIGTTQPSVPIVVIGITRVKNEKGLFA